MPQRGNILAFNQVGGGRAGDVDDVRHRQAQRRRELAQDGDEGIGARGGRTRLSAEAERMWFILESLPAMPLAALHEAGDELIAGLRQMMPGVTLEQRLIGCAS